MARRDDKFTDKDGGEGVLVEESDGITLITINRPQAMNAINASVSELLGAALRKADLSANSRAVIITGQGHRAFSAGADLKSVAEGSSIDAKMYEHWGFAGYVMHRISIPTIAAVRGFAMGGGLEIALASDLIVASDDAMFALPEVKRGLVAAAGGAFRLPMQMPRRVALEYLLTGEAFGADIALKWGLINRVVPNDEVLDEAFRLAKRIAENAPLAVRASKTLASGYGEDGDLLSDRDRWQEANRIRNRLRHTVDATEGAAAFVEKRSPVWTGK